jgi:hypothetical protein
MTPEEEIRRIERGYNAGLGTHSVADGFAGGGARNNMQPTLMPIPLQLPPKVAPMNETEADSLAFPDFLDRRNCSNCRMPYWPSVTSHPDWCAMCAGTSAAGRASRQARAIDDDDGALPDARPLRRPGMLDDSFPFPRKPAFGARLGRRYQCPGIGDSHSFVLEAHRQEYCTRACRKNSEHWKMGVLAPSKSRLVPPYLPSVLTPKKPNKNGHPFGGSQATDGATSDRWEQQRSATEEMPSVSSMAVRLVASAEPDLAVMVPHVGGQASTNLSQIR